MSESATHPLSIQQEALWFLGLLGRGGSAYVESIVRRIHGRLDVDALCSALRAVVARHDALRARFASARGRVVQIIVDLDLPCEVIELSAPEPRLLDDRLPALIDRLSGAELDLRSGALVRATVIRLADDDHILHLLFHHIVADEWSLTIIGSELAELYDAEREGRPPRLAPPGMQYPSYASWQRAWVADGGLVSQLEHWCRQLTLAPPDLDLAWDHPRQPGRVHRVASVARRLDGWEPGDLGRLAATQRATPYLVLLASLVLLLHWWSGQPRISVGVPFANRRRPEVQETVGLFVNVLPIVADPGSATTFGVLLSNLRTKLFAALPNQEVPLALLVRELRVPVERSRNPLFQVALAVDHPPDPFRLPGLRLERVDAHGGAAKFDLMLLASTRAHPPEVTLEYNADLLDQSTAERLLSDLVVLLHAVRAEPDAELERLRQSVGARA